MLELLAPAGDMQCLDTAINCGADAVYLGLDNFNARMKACNFNESNIKEVVSKAHFFGVKVYVTLNTILQNKEINSLVSAVKVAVDAKIDAFIVQDLGVAKLLRDSFDGIVLHASTQMGVHNLYGAKIAQSMGIKRVVLSRETKLEDIKEIRENTDLEIEYFVQGALCVCFSGNCYMSSVEQNASGNRGLCKQMCRLPYTAELDGKKYDGFLLSARDLCLAASVAELARAGVTSFKIEGRMRRPEYVGQAVKIYRKILDDIQRDTKVVAFDEKDEEKLKIAFNRGEYLRRAYLDDGVADVVDKRFSNHIGIEIGKVKSVKPFKENLFEITLTLSRPIENGDGLKFFDKGKEVASLGVGDVKDLGNGRYYFITKTKIEPQWQVNLIASAAQERDIASSERTVGIDMQVTAMSGERLEITAIYKNKDVCIKSTAVSDQSLERAVNAAMNAEDIEKQCRKCGGSGFEVGLCSVATDGVFIAKSVLNGLRRDVLKDLKERVIEYNSPKPVSINEESSGTVATDGLSKRQDGGVRFVKSEDLFCGGVIRKGEIVALSPKVYSVEEIDRMLAALDMTAKDVALELPVIANGKDLRILEKLLEKTAIRTLVSENIYGLYFSQKGYEVIAGQGHNVANALAVSALKHLGATAVIPSLEYPDMQSGALPILKTEETLPLMTFAHCPFKTLFGNDCSRCTYKNGLTLSRAGKKYSIRRTKLSQCYFSLYRKA